MSSPDRRRTVSRRRPRATLSREAIVDAAVAILDETGLDGLTMRAVADRLDAGAMSLYRHVASRDELLDLVVARLTADVTHHVRTGDWRADLAALAHDTRAALMRRPNLTVLLTSRAASAGSGMVALDHALGILRDAGFPPRDAVLANHALGNYVAGAALWEAVGLAGASGEDRRRRADDAARALGALPPDVAPNVTWAAGELFAGTLDDRFEFGLEVVLDGLEARLTAVDPDEHAVPGSAGS
jgi:AcrR family transcriptional regulator